MHDGDSQDVRSADSALRESPAPRLGETLAAARTNNGLSVEQLAAELRVEARLLAALEGGRFDELGPAVFVKGYIKQYAQRLNLNYADLLKRYEQDAGVQEMPIVHRSGTRWQDTRRGTRWALVLLLIVPVVAGGWWLWSSGVLDGVIERVTQRGDGDDSPQTAIAPSPASSSASGVDPTASPRGSSSAGAAQRPRNEPSPQFSAAPVTSAMSQQRTDSAGRADEGGVAAATQDLERETAPDPRQEIAWTSQGGISDGSPPASDADPAGQVGFELSVNGDCWVEIMDADGERVHFGLVRAGDTLMLAGRPPLSFVLGNASAVRLTVDGQPHAVPVDAVVGNIARFTVDPGNGPANR